MELIIAIKQLILYQGFTDFFQRMLFEELKGLDVIVEAYHEQNVTKPKAYLQNVWQPMINNQVNLYTALVEKFVISVESQEELEFPNMGSIPSNMQATAENFWQANYQHDVPSIAQILPNAYQFADTVSFGNGKFTATILYLTLKTITNPNLNPADPMPTFQNVQTGQKYQIAGTLKTVTLPGSNTLQYYRTYDLGQLPEGTYKLVSPTATAMNPAMNGWFNNFNGQPYAQVEWWSLANGVSMSAGQFTGGANYIQVTNSTSGHPYGYWAAYGTTEP